MAPCIVCAGDCWEPQWEILLRCSSCGFVRAAEIPDVPTAAELYSPDYFQGAEYGDYLADREVHLRNFAARWADMQRLAGKFSSVYEIGCAYGLFLEQVAQAGVKCAGSDVCQPAVKYARQRGLNAEGGDFLELPLNPGEHDAFCLWDTIEHLPHPEAVIARVSELLPPGGRLFLTTGDLGSLVARVRGKRWRMIHPPTHLQYFSQATMRRFLGQYGLSVRESRSVGVYRTLHSVLTALQALRKGWMGSTAGLIERITPLALQKRCGLSVNLGDIMFVAAQKEKP